MSEEAVEVSFAGMARVTEDVTSREGPSDLTRRFNARVIESFREHGGTVPGELSAISLLLLSTVGAKSGERRTVPLGYFLIDGRMVVVASMGGAPKHPPWFHNLSADPEVTIELGGETFPATAVITEGADRDRLFAGVVEQVPVFADYQAKTSRVLPVVELRRHQSGAS